jgi:hypothetical protein
MREHPPRAFPWEKLLPWAIVRVRKDVALRLDGAERTGGIACVKAVAANISRGVTTSATARTLNVSKRFVAGRQRGGKPGIVRTSRSELGMPRPRKRAASEPIRRRRGLKTPSLRRRVVTQQKNFFGPVLRSPRLLPTPRDLPSPSRALLFGRLSAGRSQRPGSGTQVVLSQHLERA